jgi:hypothetical protein
VPSAPVLQGHREAHHGPSGPGLPPAGDHLGHRPRRSPQVAALAQGDGRSLGDLDVPPVHPQVGGHLPACMPRVRWCAAALRRGRPGGRGVPGGGPRRRCRPEAERPCRGQVLLRRHRSHRQPQDGHRAHPQDRRGHGARPRGSVEGDQAPAGQSPQAGHVLSLAVQAYGVELRPHHLHLREQDDPGDEDLRGEVVRASHQGRTRGAGRGVRARAARGCPGSTEVVRSGCQAMQGMPIQNRMLVK